MIPSGFPLRLCGERILSCLRSQGVSSFVVADGDAPRQRVRLAGEHESFGEIALFEAVVLVHPHFAGKDLAAAGAAHAAFAGIGQFDTGGKRGIEDRWMLAPKRHFAPDAVQDHRDQRMRRISGFGMMLRRATRNAETLDMDMLAWKPAVDQRGLHAVNHAAGAADEGVVDVGHREQGLGQDPDFVRVEPAVEQLDILLLAAEKVVQRKSRQIAVLQVFQFFVEQRTGLTAVAVDQGEAAARLARKHGADQRKHRGDAAAGGERGVVLRLLRIERREETPVGCQHFDLVAGFQLRSGPAGKQSARYFFDGDAQFTIVHAGADRVRAAHFLAVQLCLKRQVLALDECIVFGKRGRHIEAQADRVRSLVPDFGNAQFMKSGCHDRGNAYIGLKYSNGSRQAGQRYRALQAVEPNSDRRSLLRSPQRGQAGAGGMKCSTCVSCVGRGGTMP